MTSICQNMDGMTTIESVDENEYQHWPVYETVSCMQQLHLRRIWYIRLRVYTQTLWMCYCVCSLLWCQHQAFNDAWLHATISATLMHRFNFYLLNKVNRSIVVVSDALTKLKLQNHFAKPGHIWEHCLTSTTHVCNNTNFDFMVNGKFIDMLFLIFFVFAGLKKG